MLLTYQFKVFLYNAQIEMTSCACVNRQPIQTTDRAAHHHVNMLPRNKMRLSLIVELNWLQITMSILTSVYSDQMEPKSEYEPTS